MYPSSRIPIPVANRRANRGVTPRVQLNRTPTSPFHTPCRGDMAKTSELESMKHSQCQSQHKLDRLEAAVCTLMEQQNELLRNLQQPNCTQETIDPSGIRSSTPLAPRDQHQALAEATGPAENNEPPSSTGENQMLTLAKAMGQAISENLAPLLAVKSSKNLPDKYKGEQDGSIDNWITIMKRYLEKTCAQSSELDRAWTVIEFLEQEARAFIINKHDSERDTGQKVLDILARRFGPGPSRYHIQQQFYARNREPNEDHMLYLDALEQLRNQAYPNESIEMRRLEILQRFKVGVRDERLHKFVSCHYASKHTWLIHLRWMLLGSLSSSTFGWVERGTKFRF